MRKTKFFSAVIFITLFVFAFSDATLGASGVENDYEQILQSAHDAADDERYAEALELYEQALEIQEAAYGEEDPETLDIINWIAEMYFYLEDYAKEKEYYERALTVQLKIYGEEHTDTAVFLTLTFNFK